MKKNTSDRYFNFPIKLLEGFLVNDNKILNNICDYSVYTHSLNLEYGDEVEKMKESGSYFGLTLGDDERSLINGKKLYSKKLGNSLKVGLNISVWFDYYKNDKSDFDKVCLLGFLAIKSILQKKSYCKIDNKFWLARMDGKAKSSPFNELSEPLLKYANEYQTRKIKHALRDYWGLVTYSRYTRGFYVSYKLTLNDLVFEAEKRRKSRIQKIKKKEENQAVELALKRLYENTSTAQA